MSKIGEKRLEELNMKEKLLGSVLVSHYGPFEKGEAKAFASGCLMDDRVLQVVHGVSAAGDEVCTVFSRNGEDPYLDAFCLGLIMLSSRPRDPEVQ